jgi:thiol-disulfide isomerase/thioredoxin
MRFLVSKKTFWLITIIIACSVLLCSAWVFYKPEHFAHGGKYKVVYVHSPSCPHCDAFNSAWEKFLKELEAAKIPEVSTEKTTDSSKYKVSGFPTVLFFKDGKQVKEAIGRQETPALWDHLRSAMT